MLIARIIMLYDFTILVFYLKSTPGTAPRGWRIMGSKIAHFLPFFVEFLLILPILPIFPYVSGIFKKGVSCLYASTVGVLRDIIMVIK